jgi:porphobilinogen synthase
MSQFPQIRMRRNKQKHVRHLLEQDYPGSKRFIWPIFVVEGQGIIKPIDSLPGQYYYSVDVIADEVKKVVDENDLGGLLVFAVTDSEARTENAEGSYNDNGLAQNAVKALKEKLPSIAIFADIGLTGYSTSGHAQVVNNGSFDNDKSLQIIKKIALSYARAGATGVAPSGMIDGQVMELRKELDQNGFIDTLVLSYSSKFNSNMYATFPLVRASVEMSRLDRGDYLESYRNPKSAIKESILDEEEGADILMIKPALFYLDIIQKVKEKTNLPVAVYNVSVEYAMIWAMVEKGYVEKRDLARESLCALHRAGADIIITYWANQYNEIFRNK